MNVIKNKSKRDLLSHTQYEINAKQKQHASLTDAWLRTQGINSNTFGTIHPQLLKAQQAAHHLLAHHKDLLTPRQTHTLERFRQQLANKHTRNKLKPQAAFPILNISSKINRHLFQLVKTA